MSDLPESFELKCEFIDRDHRSMLKMADEILSVIDNNEAEKCTQLVPDFVTFVRQHFAREEAFLIKNGYPDSDLHQAHHESLERQLNKMLELAKVAGQNAIAQQRLSKEIKFFTMDDVINADLDFKGFVSDLD